MKIVQRKRIFIFILIPLFLYIVLLTLQVATPAEKNNNTTKTQSPTPIQPTKAQAVTTYNKEATTLLIDKFHNRQPLSKEAQVSKDILVNKAKGSPEPLQKNPTFAVQYMKNIDAFMVEIKVVDIAKAKEDTQQWFLTQGINSVAMCNLPVVFFLNSSVARELRPLHIVFNPLLETCK